MNFPYAEHQVGATVYWYDADRDSVVRCEVAGIEAYCGKPGHWDVRYTVISKRADTPERWSAAPEDIHARMSDAFPVAPPEPAPESVDVAVAA